MAGALSFERFGATRAEIESHIISNDYCVWLLRRKVWSAKPAGGPEAARARLARASRRANI
eukprot:5390255-Prymnesium_polylepis.1